jgi:hypothetical protein
LSVVSLNIKGAKTKCIKENNPRMGEAV